MVITTNELIYVCNKLIHYLEKEKGKKIELKQDDLWYQKVWHDERNMHEKPELSLGYLDEDIEVLKKIIEGKEDANDLDLQRLGQLFITLGATMRK